MCWHEEGESMRYRPTDESGDILPVLSSSDLLRGVRATARLVTDRLQLLAGDWWENPAWGNPIADMLRETRFTEADLQPLASCLSSYIRETPGVQVVRDEAWSAEGRTFRYSCTVDAADGSAEITYEL